MDDRPTDGLSRRGAEGSCRWPRARRRIDPALAPDLGPAEERPAGGHDQSRRIAFPRGQSVGEPRLDLGELRPAPKRPARLEADADQRPFREDHVAVAGGVSIALAVTDEDDRSAGGLMGEDAIAFARPADEAIGVAIRVVDRRPPARERGAGSDDRQFGDAEALE